VRAVQEDGSARGEEPAESRLRDSTLRDLLASRQPATDGGPIFDNSILAELQDRVRTCGSDRLQPDYCCLPRGRHAPGKRPGTARLHPGDARVPI